MATYARNKSQHILSIQNAETSNEKKSSQIDEPRLQAHYRDYSSSENRRRDASSQPTYRVAQVLSNGKLSIKSLQISEILRDSTMHVRDLFSLALTTGQERKKKFKRPPAAILPRGNEVIVSFGHVRAVIGQESGMIFDAHDPSTQLFANHLASTFEYKMNEAHEFSCGENLSIDFEYNVKAQYLGGPFELVFIEEILRDVCDTYNRRIRVFEPIVDSLLSRVSNEVFSESGVHRLVPVKDSLQEFEMHVKQELQCLTHLLENDEDMLGLLLTEQAAAQKKGEDLQHQMHESVELLLEEYVRQLDNMLQEIDYLLRRVQSKQELVAISLDAYRNRMIRMNVYLSIVGIGLATSTTVAGFYGMNLVNGLETSPTAFNDVVLATSIVGVVLFAGCVSYLSGPRMKKRAVQRLEELETISGALSNMNSLDYAVKVMINEGKPITRDAFREILAKCPSSSHIPDKEVDMLFGVLDISQDGFLFTEDFRSIESFGAKHQEKKEAAPLTFPAEF